jgi:hypothetical protein
MKRSEFNLPFYIAAFARARAPAWQFAAAID